MRSAIAATALFVACSPDSGDRVLGLQAHSFTNSVWSEPVNLGAPVNSAAEELHASLSPDELSLYFNSTRARGLGAADIWVSRRACLHCPWEASANLGPLINSSRGEGGPNLSVDGHVLLFHSGRPGGHGAADIYVSRRADPSDDFGWGPAVNLGPDVNTAGAEIAPSYVRSDGADNLYFQRGNLALLEGDIYSAAVAHDGQTRGPSVLVTEVSDPTTNDGGPTLRADGRELFFWRLLLDTGGQASLLVSTRRSIHDPWSSPVNPGPPVSQLGMINPSLSHDGRTLLFSSDRPGGLGGLDIWMSTRTPSGH